MEIKYFGESICSAIIKKTNNPCEKKAYYISKGKLFCGTHSRMLEREVLPKNPNETQMKNDANNKIKLDADEQAKRNRELGRTGTIKLYRMLMFGDPIVEKGYYNIFPNFKHGPRKDGKGLPKKIQGLDVVVGNTILFLFYNFKLHLVSILYKNSVICFDDSIVKN
jgi:hypothetical protein